MKLPIWLLIIVVVFYSGCAKEAELNEVNKVSIISIAPSSGPAGTTVVIKGANFGADLSDNVVRSIMIQLPCLQPLSIPWL